ncbi:MAG: hypothetical protein ABSF99_05335 [Anaerolineales bacterium]
MPTIQKYFTHYVVYYISGSSPTIGLAQDAEIDCFTENDGRAGIIYFYPDSVPLPENHYTVNGIYLHYRLSRFADVMTMLKEEKPLYLYFDTTKKFGYVGTNSEPVGEQEGV